MWLVGSRDDIEHLAVLATRAEMSPDRARLDGAGRVPEAWGQRARTHPRSRGEEHHLAQIEKALERPPPHRAGKTSGQAAAEATPTDHPARAGDGHSCRRHGMAAAISTRLRPDVLT